MLLGDKYDAGMGYSTEQVIVVNEHELDHGGPWLQVQQICHMPLLSPVYCSHTL